MGALTAAALLVTGCTVEEPAAAQTPAPARTTAPPAGHKAPGDPAAARAAAYRKWGLKPFAAPPAPPSVKPVVRPAGGPVPVISEIPTREKIVFLTIDDGAEKDPGFVRMMKDLKVPFTMFLTDASIRADYPYFAPLIAQGHGLANHTLTHPNLPTLGPEAQRREICGQQTRLKERYGITPRLFRPPYGNWNEATRAAAGSAGSTRSCCGASPCRSRTCSTSAATGSCAPATSSWPTSAARPSSRAAP
ncbi:polysaccharide deacetylase family protein [Streptomyces venezuelae ATCC 10712]